MVRIKAGQPGSTIRLGQIFGHSDLLLTLASRDIRVRYKQTLLGVLWVVLQPLLAALIFTFVFGLIAGLNKGNGKPYILVAFAGMLAWNLFSGVLQRSSMALLSNAHLVTKVYFAREVLPLSAALATLLDFAVALSVMGVLLAWFGIWPGWPLLLLPLWVALLAGLGLGLGLVAGSLMAQYRDVQHIVPVALTLGLYASPVAWPASMVPEKYRFVLDWNPLSGPIAAFRWSLIGEGALNYQALAYSAAVTAFFLWLGMATFRKMERRLADVI